MRIRILGGRAMAALVAVGAMLSVGRVEGSPVTAGGISVKGGVTQGGDPQYTFYLDVFLIDDTIPAYVYPGSATATLTVDGLTGIGSVDTYLVNYEYFSPPEAIWNPTLSTGTAASDYFGYSPITASGPDPLWLFQLVVTTPTNTSNGASPGDEFTYSWTIGTGNNEQTGSGFGYLTLGPPPVPEPSSIVLMLVGGSVVPYLEFHRRRRRQARRVG